MICGLVEGLNEVVGMASDADEAGLVSGVAAPPRAATAVPLSGILGGRGVPAYVNLRARKSGVPNAGVPNPATPVPGAVGALDAGCDVESSLKGDNLDLAERMFTGREGDAILINQRR